MSGSFGEMDISTDQAWTAFEKATWQEEQKHKLDSIISRRRKGEEEEEDSGGEEERKARRRERKKDDKLRDRSHPKRRVKKSASDDETGGGRPPMRRQASSRRSPRRTKSGIEDDRSPRRTHSDKQLMRGHSNRRIRDNVSDHKSASPSTRRGTSRTRSARNVRNQGLSASVNNNNESTWSRVNKYKGLSASVKAVESTTWTPTGNKLESQSEQILSIRRPMASLSPTRAKSSRALRPANSSDIESRQSRYKGLGSSVIGTEPTTWTRTASHNFKSLSPKRTVLIDQETSWSRGCGSSSIRQPTTSQTKHESDSSSPRHRPVRESTHLTTRIRQRIATDAFPRGCAQVQSLA